MEANLCKFFPVFTVFSPRVVNKVPNCLLLGINNPPDHNGVKGIMTAAFSDDNRTAREWFSDEIARSTNTQEEMFSPIKISSLI